MYPGFELSGQARRARLRAALAEVATAFDLLCLVANAAQLSRSPSVDPLAADGRHGIGWSAEGFAHGALPPFGRLEVRDRALVLSAENRIPADGSTAEQPDFLSHSLALPVDGLTWLARDDGSVALQAEQVDVVVRALDGDGAGLVEWLSAHAAAADEGFGGA